MMRIKCTKLQQFVASKASNVVKCSKLLHQMQRYCIKLHQTSNASKASHAVNNAALLHQVASNIKCIKFAEVAAR
jgi:isochorismate hydrolase